MALEGSCKIMESKRCEWPNDHKHDCSLKKSSTLSEHRQTIRVGDWFDGETRILNLGPIFAHGHRRILLNCSDNAGSLWQIRLTRSWHGIEALAVFVGADNTQNCVPLKDKSIKRQRNPKQKKAR